MIVHFLIFFQTKIRPHFSPRLHSWAHQWSYSFWAEPLAATTVQVKLLAASNVQIYKFKFIICALAITLN